VLEFAGLTAAVAAAGALIRQRTQSKGDWIDVSIMASFASSIDRRAVSLVACEYTGERMERISADQSMAAPPSYNPCKDGYFHITVSSGRRWPAFIRAVGEPLLQEKRFLPPIVDRAIKEEFDAFWIPWCLERTKTDLVTRFQAHGIPCAPVNTVADLSTDAQLASRDYFQPLTHPVVGRASYAGMPFRMSAAPRMQWGPAPGLGEHTDAVLRWLGCQPDEIAKLRAQGVV
jgi:crotonobetainyl-CoA:carnitine CoA-transferase CaiB-like acyl-CoA transferase